MSDNELIRRGDAADFVLKMSADDNSSWGMIMEGLRTLPSVQVTVKPLEWVDFADRGAKAQAWNYANYTLQKWSDGRWELGASYSGYTTSIYGIDRFFPTLEAAQAAAQAHADAAHWANTKIGGE